MQNSGINILSFCTALAGPVGGFTKKPQAFFRRKPLTPLDRKPDTGHRKPQPFLGDVLQILSFI